MAAQVGVADVPTEEYAQAMEEAIDAATKAEAEANRLKRKYEPDEPEVRLDKILRMSNNYGRFHMRVQIYTGETMVLTLIPMARHNNECPNWRFVPNLLGRRTNTEHIAEFGIYEVAVSLTNYNFHHLLVTFNPKGICIREDTKIGDEDWGEDWGGALIIETLDEQPEFTLTHE
jgi:hypothetical protein